MGQSILRDREAPFQSARFFAPPIERESGQDSGTGTRVIGGDANELGDAGGGPGKSFLFSLTTYSPEIGLSGDRVGRSVELDTSVGSGAPSTVLENPRERTTFAPGRTHNRSRSPR
jgi:hypothetical protein